ncbi:MAG: hypothetical protein ABL999_05995 [Pyrinomonadaceae bacterium]
MKSSEEKRLEHIIRRMQTDTSIDAPAGALRYAKNLYRSMAPAPQPSLLKRIIAVLNIDLAPNQAAFGERSGAEGQPRQMLFDADEYAIDMRIKEAADGFNLRGQVLGYGFENGMVELTAPVGSVVERLDEFSEFTLNNVQPGEYSLTVRGTGTEIFVEKFTLS